MESEPTYFNSPTSSKEIITLLRTCTESRLIAKRFYTLLFPASSTWFSLSSDYLYLDFGQSPHTLQYHPRTFTSYLPEPDEVAQDPRLSRYKRPIFDEQLTQKVKNIALGDLALYPGPDVSRFLKEFIPVFSGVERIVLSDQLHSLCYEAGEDLVWLSCSLEDDSLWEYHDSREIQDSERNKWHRHLLWKMQMWGGSLYARSRRDVNAKEFLQLFNSDLSAPVPTVSRNGIVTRKFKNRLIDICGSEEDFGKLEGIDYRFVDGLFDYHSEYHGPLDLSAQISILKLILENMSTGCPRNQSDGCSITNFNTDLVDCVPDLLATIDNLEFEKIRLAEAEEF